MVKLLYYASQNDHMKVYLDEIRLQAINEARQSKLNRFDNVVEFGRLTREAVNQAVNGQSPAMREIATQSSRMPRDLLINTEEEPKSTRSLRSDKFGTPQSTASSTKSEKGLRLTPEGLITSIKSLRKTSPRKEYIRNVSPNEREFKESFEQRVNISNNPEKSKIQDAIRGLKVNRVARAINNLYKDETPIPTTGMKQHEIVSLINERGHNIDDILGEYNSIKQDAELKKNKQ